MFEISYHKKFHMPYH